MSFSYDDPSDPPDSTDPTNSFSYDDSSAPPVGDPGVPLDRQDTGNGDPGVPLDYGNTNVQPAAPDDPAQGSSEDPNYGKTPDDWRIPDAAPPPPSADLSPAATSDPGVPVDDHGADTRQAGATAPDPGVPLDYGNTNVQPSAPQSRGGLGGIFDKVKSVASDVGADIKDSIDPDQQGWLPDLHPDPNLDIKGDAASAAQGLSTVAGAATDVYNRTVGEGALIANDAVRNGNVGSALENAAASIPYDITGKQMPWQTDTNYGAANVLAEGGNGLSAILPGNAGGGDAGIYDVPVVGGAARVVKGVWDAGTGDNEPSIDTEQLQKDVASGQYTDAQLLDKYPGNEAYRVVQSVLNPINFIEPEIAGYKAGDIVANVIASPSSRAISDLAAKTTTEGWTPEATAAAQQILDARGTVANRGIADLSPDSAAVHLTDARVSALPGVGTISEATDTIPTLYEGAAAMAQYDALGAVGTDALKQAAHEQAQQIAVDLSLRNTGTTAAAENYLDAMETIHQGAAYDVAVQTAAGPERLQQLAKGTAQTAADVIPGAERDVAKVLAEKAAALREGALPPRELQQVADARRIDLAHATPQEMAWARAEGMRNILTDDVRAAYYQKAGAALPETRGALQKSLSGTFNAVRGLLLMSAAPPLAIQKFTDEWARALTEGVVSVRPADMTSLQALARYGSDRNLLGQGDRFRAFRDSGTLRNSALGNDILPPRSLNPLAKSPYGFQDTFAKNNRYGEAMRPGDRIAAAVGAPFRGVAKWNDSLISAPTQHVLLNAFYHDTKTLDKTRAAIAEKAYRDTLDAGLGPEEAQIVRDRLATATTQRDFVRVANDIQGSTGVPIDIAPRVPDAGVARGVPSGSAPDGIDPHLWESINRTGGQEPGLVAETQRTGYTGGRDAFGTDRGSGDSRGPFVQSILDQHVPGTMDDVTAHLASTRTAEQQAAVKDAALARQNGNGATAEVYATGGARKPNAAGERKSYPTGMSAEEINVKYGGFIKSAMDGKIPIGNVIDGALKADDPLAELARYRQSAARQSRTVTAERYNAFKDELDKAATEYRNGGGGVAPPADAGVSGKTWFHGSGSDQLNPAMLHAEATNPGGLFGPGMYLTDNPQIASEYAATRARQAAMSEGYRTGRFPAETPTVYETRVNANKVLDLEQPAPADVRAIFDKTQRGMDQFTADPTKTTQDLYRDLKRITRDTFSDNYVEVNQALHDAGYDGLTHTGGQRVGNVEHRVFIVLEPQGGRGVISEMRPRVETPPVAPEATPTADPGVSLAADAGTPPPPAALSPVDPGVPIRNIRSGGAAGDTRLVGNTPITDPGVDLRARQWAHDQIFPNARPDAANALIQRGAELGQAQRGAVQEGLNRGYRIIGNQNDQTTLGSWMKNGIGGATPPILPFAPFHIHSAQFWARTFANHPALALGVANALQNLDDYGTLNLPGGRTIGDLTKLVTGAHLVDWAMKAYRYDQAVGQQGNNNPLQRIGKDLAYNTVGNNAFVSPFPYISDPIQSFAQSHTNPLLTGKTDFATGQPAVDPRDQYKTAGSIAGTTGVAQTINDATGQHVPRGLITDLTNPGQVLGNAGKNLVSKASGSDLRQYNPQSQLPYKSQELMGTLGWDTGRFRGAEADALTGTPTTPDGKVLLDAYQRLMDRTAIGKLAPIQFGTNEKGVYPPFDTSPTATAAHFRAADYQQRAGEGGKDAGVGLTSKAGNYYVETPDQAAQSTARAQLKEPVTPGNVPTMDYARDFLQRTGNTFPTPGNRPESQAVADRSQAIFQSPIDANAKRTGAGLPQDQRMQQINVEQVLQTSIGNGGTAQDLLRQPGNYYDTLDKISKATDPATKRQLEGALATVRAADIAQVPGLQAYFDRLHENSVAKTAAAGGTPTEQWYNGQPQPVRDAYDAFNDLRNSADYKRYAELEKQQAAAGPFGSPGEKAWYAANKTELARVQGIVDAAEQSIVSRTGQNPKQVANQEAIAAGRAAPYAKTDIATPSATSTVSASTKAANTYNAPRTYPSRSGATFSANRGNQSKGTSSATTEALSAKADFYAQYNAIKADSTKTAAAVRADPAVQNVLQGLHSAAEWQAATAKAREIAAKGGGGATGSTTGGTKTAGSAPAPVTFSGPGFGPADIKRLMDTGILYGSGYAPNGAPAPAGPAASTKTPPQSKTPTAAPKVDSHGAPIRNVAAYEAAVAKNKKVA